MKTTLTKVLVLAGLLAFFGQALAAPFIQCTGHAGEGHEEAHHGDPSPLPGHHDSVHQEAGGHHHQHEDHGVVHGLDCDHSCLHCSGPGSTLFFQALTVPAALQAVWTAMAGPASPALLPERLFRPPIPA